MMWDHRGPITNHLALFLLMVFVAAFAVPARAVEKLCAAEIANNDLGPRLALSQALIEAAYGPSSKLSSLTGGIIRENFDVGTINVAATEFSVLEGDYPVRYLFLLTHSSGQPAGALFLASYLPLTEMAWELGDIGPGTRIFHINVFEDNQTSFLRSYRCEPSYALVRSAAVELARAYDNPDLEAKRRDAREAEYDASLVRVDGLVKAGNVASAETDIENILARTRSAFGLGTLREARILGGLATIQYQRGAHRKAMASMSEEMAILEVAFGETHEHVAGTLRNMGIIALGGLNEAVEAELLLKRAVDIYELNSLLNTEGGQSALRGYMAALTALGRQEEGRAILQQLQTAIASGDNRKAWREDEPSGSLIHIASGISFPQSSEGLTRRETTIYESTGRDVSVSYRGKVAQSLLVVTVYAYPKEGRNVQTEALEILNFISNKPGASVVAKGDYSIVAKVAKTTGYGGSAKVPTAQAGDVVEGAYVFETGSYFVKFRITYVAAELTAAKENIDTLMKAILLNERSTSPGADSGTTIPYEKISP